MRKLSVTDVKPGDFVVLRDKDGNFIEGQVTYQGSQWMVRAFNTFIVFAHDRNNGLGPRMNASINLVGHTGQLINEL